MEGKGSPRSRNDDDFRNVIIVMTTNAGAQEMSRSSVGFVKQDHSSDGMEAIRKLFTPEFRNRLDATIQFKSLERGVVSRVVDKLILELEAQLQDKMVTLELSDAAREWIAERGYDAKMGARPMARVIQNHIKKPLANELLFGDGKAYGLETILQKEHGRLSGWISYTLSRAIYQVDEINGGDPYPAYSDRPHDFSLYLSWVLHPRITLSTNFIYMTGAGQLVSLNWKRPVYDGS